MSHARLGDRLRKRPRKRFTEHVRLGVQDTKHKASATSLSMLEQRFLDYLMGVSFARRDSAKASSEPAGVLPSRKLSIDQQRDAQLERKMSRIELLQKTLQTRLAANLQQQVQARLEDNRALLDTFLMFKPNLQHALRLLQQDGEHITRLELLLKNESWLTRELLNLVNSSSFKTFSDRQETVKSFTEALLCFGRERLLMLLCGFCIRSVLPTKQQLTPLLDRKLLEHSQATANTAFQLSRWEGVDPVLAYQLGMFHQIGHLCLLSMLDSLNQENLQLHLHKARLDGNAPLHEALRTLPQPVDLLRHLMGRFGGQLAAQLVDAMDIKLDRLTGIYQEVGSHVPFKQMSPLARLLVKADSYARYRTLNDARLLTPDDSAQLFTDLGFSEQHLEDLSRLNLKRPPFSLQ